MTQKRVFLESEGDAWFRRNEAALTDPARAAKDPLLAELETLPIPTPAQLLEIGCSDGWRLQRLRQDGKFICHGIEPSTQAVEKAQATGLDVRQGTADALPFKNAAFDVVVFGFCLYLCDREDLFRIAEEADRVLKSPGWLLIHDFYSETPRSGEYHHRPGVRSYKMPYRRMFDWHPGYAVLSERIRHHVTGAPTDDPDQQVATTVLQKRMSG
jgi:SAM-dependent methyltransferase